MRSFGCEVICEFLCSLFFFVCVWVFVCLFLEVLVRCSVSTIWRLCVNWWRLRNEPRHVNDPQTLVKANAQDSWTSHRLLKTLLTWRELTSCRLPRLLLTSAFSHAFWCIIISHTRKAQWSLINSYPHHFKHIPRHILLISCIGGQTRPPLTPQQCLV